MGENLEWPLLPHLAPQLGQQEMGLGSCEWVLRIWTEGAEKI